MKKAIYALSASAFLIAFALSLASPNFATAEKQKVTICHATDSNKNPYRTESPNANGNVSGHDGHNGPIWFSGIDEKWGDIIPPFDYTVKVKKQEVLKHYDGKNWDNEGQAIWNNGCKPVTEVTPVAPTFTEATCDKLGSYTIPASETVTYEIGGNTVAASTYTVANGSSVTITAVANKGFYISEETTSTWTHTFAAPSNCGQGGGKVLGKTTQVTKVPVGSANGGEGGINDFSLTSLARVW